MPRPCRREDLAARLFAPAHRKRIDEQLESNGNRNSRDFRSPAPRHRYETIRPCRSQDRRRIGAQNIYRGATLEPTVWRRQPRGQLRIVKALPQFGSHVLHGPRKGRIALLELKHRNPDRLQRACEPEALDALPGLRSRGPHISHESHQRQNVASRGSSSRARRCTCCRARSRASQAMILTPLR